MNITTIISEFEKKFPEFAKYIADENDGYNGEIEQFLKQSLISLLDEIDVEENDEQFIDNDPFHKLFKDPFHKLFKVGFNKKVSDLKEQITQLKL